MNRFILKNLPRFLRDESGPTAVEYAVLLALIVITCIGAVNALSVATRGSLDTSSQAIQAVL